MINKCSFDNYDYADDDNGEYDNREDGVVLDNRINFDQVNVQ